MSIVRPVLVAPLIGLLLLCLSVQIGRTGHRAAPAGLASGDVFVVEFNKNQVVKVSAGGTTQTAFGTGLLNPTGIAVDALGNIFVTDIGNGRVVKIAPDGTQTTVATRLSTPAGIAVDAVGNVYVADVPKARVVKIPAAGGASTTVGVGLGNPEGVAVDVAGNVYIADQLKHQVFKVAPDGTQTTVGSGLTTPWGVAVDALGNVFIADLGAGRVVKVAADGTQTTAFTASGPTWIAVGPNGDLYVTESLSGAVVRLAAGAAAPTAFGTGWDDPVGVAVYAPAPVFTDDDPPSPAFLARSYSYQFAATTGPTFTLESGTLPPGLSLAPDGLLSGTPTTAGAFTFTVKAGNQVASTVGRTHTITVVGPAFRVLPDGGDGQSAIVGTPFAAPLSVEVVDALGNPVPGQVVTFTVTSGAAAFAGGPVVTATTDQRGIAITNTLTAGATPGRVTITATTPGATGRLFVETVTTPASLSTSKAVVSVMGAPATADTPVRGGDVLVYRITVANSGGSPGSTVLSDPVPVSTTYAGVGEDWSCATDSPAGAACDQTVTVPAGSTVTKTFTTTVGPLLAGTRTVSNTVTASSGDCVACTVTNPTVPDLDTTKILASVDGGQVVPITAGDRLAYSIRTTNRGGTLGTTTLTETVPAGTSFDGDPAEGWSCPVGSAAGTICAKDVSIAAGTTVSTVFGVSVVAPMLLGTLTIDNAVVTSDGTCSSCSVSSPTAAALDVEKTVSTINQVAATALTPVKAGDVVSYDVTVTNTGGSNGSSTLTDDGPAHTTYTGVGERWLCPADSPAGTDCVQDVAVPANTSVKRHYTVTVESPLPPGTGAINNTVTSSTGACSRCLVVNPTVGSLATTLTLDTVNNAPVGINQKLADGDVLGYTVTVTNRGGVAGDTVLTESVPPGTTFTGAAEGWSCAVVVGAKTPCLQTVSVTPFSSVTLHFTATVDSSAARTVHFVVNTVTTSVGTCSSCQVSTPLELPPPPTSGSVPSSSSSVSTSSSATSSTSSSATSQPSTSTSTSPTSSTAPPTTGTPPDHLPDTGFSASTPLQRGLILLVLGLAALLAARRRTRDQRGAHQ